MTRPRTIAVLAVVALTAAAALAVRFASVRIPMGGYPDSVLRAEWRRSRPLVLEPPGAADGRNVFYYRPLPSSVSVHVPLRPAEPAGEVGLTLRTATNIRARVEAFVGAERAATAVLVPGGHWTETRMVLPAAAFEAGTSSSTPRRSGSGSSSCNSPLTALRYLR
jgi:putative intracellular protease/amidase